MLLRSNQDENPVSSESATRLKAERNRSIRRDNSTLVDPADLAAIIGANDDRRAHLIAWNLKSNRRRLIWRKRYRGHNLLLAAASFTAQGELLPVPEINYHAHRLRRRQRRLLCE
jgi:hypothetical protein